MNWVLQSLRLKLRPCKDADVDLLLDHWTQPSVRRYLFDDRITNWETVAGFVAASQASFQKNGYGLWVLIGTENQFQGVCGFCESPLEKCDLMFSIAPLYWGQGLATESAQYVMQYAFETLKFPQINSTVDQPNKASIRVLEKLGMSLVKEELNNNSILYYALTAKDYYSQNPVS